MLPTLKPAAKEGAATQFNSKPPGGALDSGKKVGVQVCLQARLSSYRLPGKVLLRLGDKTVLEHAMLSLRQPGVQRYVLLTTRQDQQKLARYAEHCGFLCFGGEEENVLQRFVEALRVYPCSYLIRATADNPLVFPEPMKALLRLARTSPGPDYGFFRGLPLGAGVELVRTKTLLQAWTGEPNAYQCEHVTPYLYQHPQSFRLFQPWAPQRWRGPDDSQITLDTVEDYATLQQLFVALYRQKPIPSHQIVDYLWRLKKTKERPPGIYPSEPVVTG